MCVVSQRRAGAYGGLELLLGWLASDITLDGNYVVAGTTQPWQFAALYTLLDKPEEAKIEYFSVTLKGLKPGVEMKWPRETLNRLVEEGGWVKSVVPGVEKFDDLIRLDWRSVKATVEKARNELTPLITCGGGQCAEKFDDMLRELEKFVADVERWARGEMHWEEADKFYRRARKYLAPALALLELKNAETLEERQKALWHLSLIFTTAVAGDGTVKRRYVQLASGEGGAALLWLAALKKAGEMAGFEPSLRVAGNNYRLEFASRDAVALTAVMSAEGLNPKAEKAVDMFREEAERGNVNVDVKLVDVQKTKEGAVAIVNVKAGPWEEEYRVHLEKEVELWFRSADVDRVHQATHVLRLLGVKTEPKKESDRNVWYIDVSTNALADKRVLPKFREALAKAVKEAEQRGFIDAEKAKKWTEKLEEGVTVAEDKPMFTIRIASGGLNIVYYTTSSEKLRHYANQLEKLGLEKDTHFTVKKPENDKKGHLYITAEGVKKLAELAKHATDPETRARAEQWVNHLLARAEESGGEETREKLEELIAEGERRGVLTLIRMHEVEIEEGDVKTKHLVEVKQIDAKIDGNKLRIYVKATVDGVEIERAWTFYRDRGRVRGYVLTRTGTPSGRETDVKRLQVLSELIFGKPGNLTGDGGQLLYTRRHLENALRFEEIKDVAERWIRDKTQQQ